MSAPEFVLDRAAVRRSFCQAATTYDGAAVLQREVAARLLERVELLKIAPRRILDVGSGTGRCARALARRFRTSEVWAVDLAPPMLRAGRPRWWERLWPWTAPLRRVAAEAEHLPFPAASMDLIVSNLMLQWCDPAVVFAEFARVLRPGGAVLFTTFGPDTLRELRAAWAVADASAHVHAFLDMHDVGDALVGAPLAEPVMDVELLTLTYPTVRAVLVDLKAIGAHNAAAARRPTLTGKARFARFEAAYLALADTGGRIPATYEVVYGHAWAPLARTTAVALTPRRGR